MASSRQRSTQTELGQSARPQVIVIGAGLAGLAAAYELDQAGVEVIVLEALHRPGGRVVTLREPFSDGLHAEGGAAAIWPFDDDIIRRYLEAFDLPIAAPEPRTGPSAYHYRGRRWVARQGEHVDWPLDLSTEEADLGLQGMIGKYLGDATEELIEAAKSGWPADVIERYDKVSFGEYLQERGASPDAIELLMAFTPDFVGEGPFNSSALDMLRYRVVARSLRGPLEQIEGGNDRLPRAFAERLSHQIHYGAAVDTVDQYVDSVFVTYTQAGRRRTVAADRVICAIPFSVLRNLQISPPLSAEKRRAIRELGYISGAYTYVQTRRNVWVEDGFSGRAFTDQGTGKFWDEGQWHTRPGERGLLTGFIVGESARWLESVHPGQQAEFILNQAGLVFPGIEEQAEVVSASRWTANSWSLGVTAWFRPGQMAAFLPHVGRPEGRLHFAGEHTASVHLLGFMQGALESGIRAAQEVQSAL